MEEEIRKYQSELTVIGETLAEIKIQNGSVFKRLDDIERKQGMNEYFEHFKLRENENQPHEGYGTTFTSTGGVRKLEAAQAGVEDIQNDFVRVKDSVSKVKLPLNYKLNDNRFSVDKKDSTAYNILSKCARYSETAIKLLQDMPPPEEGSDSEKYLDSIATVQLAQQRYLQQQYAALIVNKDFGQKTAKVFRSLQSNTTAFPKESLDNLKAAVQLTSNQSDVPQTQYRGRGRGYNQYGSFGRGFRGRARGRSDVFDQFVREVPQHRPQNENE